MGPSNILNAKANTKMAAGFLQDEGVGWMVTVYMQVPVSLLCTVMRSPLSASLIIFAPSTIRDSHGASDEAWVFVKSADSLMGVGVDG